MPASYVNFYITNKTIIIPVFNDPIWDKNAINVLQNCFPNHKINSFYTREVLLGGGNIHCIIQQEL